MKGDNPFDGLHFHDELPLGPRSPVEDSSRPSPTPLYFTGRSDLRLKLNVAQSKLDLQGALINRLQQSGSKVTMDLYRSPNDRLWSVHSGPALNPP